MTEPIESTHRLNVLAISKKAIGTSISLLGERLVDNNDRGGSYGIYVKRSAEACGRNNHADDDDIMTGSIIPDCDNNLIKAVSQRGCME